jgi:double zinc ribbon protein
MSLIAFVQNYQDLSTDRGYQFKFFCDKCQNGFLTAFQTSAIGVAETALRVAGNLLGGVFNTAGNSAYEIQRAIGGPAHDAALGAAVEEGKRHFHQCTRCGHWVCPEVCWNEGAGLCNACAPNFQVELSSAHAQAKVNAARQQLADKANATDLTSGVDMSAKAVLRAPAAAPGEPGRCSACGAAAGTGRFCAQCGAEQHPAGCPDCGGALAPNARFCPNCGHKVA